MAAQTARAQFGCGPVVEAVCGQRGWARDAVSRVVACIDRETDTDCEEWGFVLMGPIENATVVEWLMENSKRRNEAVRLWATLFTVIRWDTGEIVISRGELADMLDITPQNVSRIMGELASINAISKKKEGREVRYFLNPKAGTRLSGRARDDAQADAGQLTIFDVLEGGQDAA